MLRINSETNAEQSQGFYKIFTCLKERLEMAAALGKPASSSSSSSSAIVTEFIGTKVAAATNPIASHVCIIFWFLLLSVWSHCILSIQVRATMFKSNLSFTIVVHMTHSALGPDIAWEILGYSSQLRLFVLCQLDQNCLIATLSAAVFAVSCFCFCWICEKGKLQAGFQGVVQRWCWINASTIT